MVCLYDLRPAATPAEGSDDPSLQGYRGEFAGESWIQLSDPGKYVERIRHPEVNFDLRVRNRQTEPLKNIVLRFRVTRAGVEKNLVPPLCVSLPKEDVVVEGEVPLTNVEVEPNTTVDLATVSFVPGRQFMEFPIRRATERGLGMTRYEMDPDRTEYQWFDLRLELDDLASATLTATSVSSSRPIRPDIDNRPLTRAIE